MDFLETIRRAYDLAELPYLSTDIRYAQTSYDRAGGNCDYNNWHYEDTHGDKVIFDVMGTGCVYKIFLPTSGHNAADSGFLKIYVDFENETDPPLVEGTLTEIFGGKHPAFPAELVTIGVPDHSAFVSYVPIPFQKRLKITSDCPGPLFYHHIDYRLFAPGTPVESWRGPEDAYKTKKLIEHFGSSGQAFPATDNTTRFPAASLPQNTEISLFQLDTETPSQITSFRLKLDGITHHAADNDNFASLAELYLQITFDDAAVPQVSAPLSGFFAMPDFGIDKNSMDMHGQYYRTHAYIAGLDHGDWLYMRFCMPFRKRVQAVLVNHSTRDFTHCQAEICQTDFDVSRAFGYFHAQTQVFEAMAEDRNDIQLLSCTGSGVFVGISSSMDSNTDIEHSYYLEGDEHIYVDGSKSPQINGTGTEDFYNGAYYWRNGTHTMPLYGCGYNAKWSLDGSPHNDEPTYRSMAYRFMVGDSIPFRSSFLFRIEHGFVNDCYEKGRAVLFYYLHPEQRLETIDTLHFAVEEELKAHRYDGSFNMSGTSSDRCTLSVCFSRYEGLCSGKSVSLSGRVMRRGADFSWKYTLPVEDGGGYLALKRVLEYTFLNQRAQVYIDGVLAGIWYDAGCNTAMRFRESEFAIAPSLTTGKKEITVRLVTESNMFSVISVTLVRYGRKSTVYKSSSVKTGSGRYAEILQNLQNLIRTSLTTGNYSQLHGDELSTALYISPQHLRRVVRKCTDMSLTDYLLLQRIEYSKELLSTTNLPVKSVALSVGMMDVSYFSRVFKKLTGETCLEYRAHLPESHPSDSETTEK